MQRISVNVILRTDRKKDCLCPLYIRIVYDRKKIDIRATHAVAENDLLPNGSVKNNVFNSWAINADLQKYLDEVNKIILFHRVNEITLTKKSFTDLYRKKLDTSLLYKYIRTQAAQMNICKRRLQSYNSLAKHIEKHFSNRTLADCTYPFLIEIEKWFIQVLKFNQNTCSANFAKLKAILNAAYKQKLIKENPFNHYKIKGYTSTRQFLTMDEVLRIEIFYSENKNPQLKNICEIFLFLCYTGMRIGDFEALQFTNIKNGCIDYIQQKTKEPCFIPLSEPAKRFVTKSGFTFKKTTAKNINEYIKIIGIDAAITKPLSCHVARHTFATLSLQLGIDLIVISKMLGHTKISTTMIYTKVLEEQKINEMIKWSGFLGFKA